MRPTLPLPTIKETEEGWELIFRIGGTNDKPSITATNSLRASGEIQSVEGESGPCMSIDD